MNKILIKQVESVHVERWPYWLSFLLSQQKIHCCRSNYAKIADDVNIHDVEFQSCITHFEDVKQSTSLISKARLNKLVSCQNRWIKLEGEKTDLCRKSYEHVPDQQLLNSRQKWLMHENCYKRICDENKIKKAEDRFRSTQSVTSDVPGMSSQLKRSSRKASHHGRNEHVLPVQCIICEKDTDLFVMVSSLQ